MYCFYDGKVFHGKKAKKENFKLCMLILKVDLNKST